MFCICHFSNDNNRSGSSLFIHTKFDMICAKSLFLSPKRVNTAKCVFGIISLCTLRMFDQKHRLFELSESVLTAQTACQDLAISVSRVDAESSAGTPPPMCPSSQSVMRISIEMTSNRHHDSHRCRQCCDACGRKDDTWLANTGFGEIWLEFAFNFNFRFNPILAFKPMNPLFPLEIQH